MKIHLCHKIIHKVIKKLYIVKNNKILIILKSQKQQNQKNHNPNTKNFKFQRILTPDYVKKQISMI